MLGQFHRAAIATIVASILCAQATAASAATAHDIAGTWQGTVAGPMGAVRRIMEVTKHGNSYSVVIHSIDETDTPLVTRNVTVHGSSVTMVFDMNTSPWLDYHRTYKTTLSPDGRALTGTWLIPGMKEGSVTNYRRVARATWPIWKATTRMVQVDANVRDEAVDFGGKGSPIVLLAGLGATAHEFFGLVPALLEHHHVYAITRRGFGLSSKPAPTASNYSADRLADDVIAVIDALKIEKPILIGHSIAGEELSDIATRYPRRARALVYLDAGYRFALDPGTPDPFANATPGPGDPTPDPISEAVVKGVRSFKGPFDLPILSIYAFPHVVTDETYYGPNPRPQDVAKQDADDRAGIEAFAKALPNATIIEIPNARHFLYISNRDEVVRDINAFISRLPQK